MQISAFMASIKRCFLCHICGKSGQERDRLMQLSYCVFQRSPTTCWSRTCPPQAYHLLTLLQPASTTPMGNASNTSDSTQATIMPSTTGIPTAPHIRYETRVCYGCCCTQCKSCAKPRLYWTSADAVQLLCSCKCCSWFCSCAKHGMHYKCIVPSCTTIHSPCWLTRRQFLYLSCCSGHWRVVILLHNFRFL